MQSRGFTLIELMVAVAIFAVVAAIAVPIYTQYTQRGYRAEVQADMLACAQAFERANAVDFTYANVLDGGGGIDPAVCTPRAVQQGRYNVTAVADVNTFTITASPIDPGPMAGDGDLTLDQAGNRTWNEDNAGGIDPQDNDWEEG